MSEPRAAMSGPRAAMSEPRSAVELYVYDLSLGLAALLAPAIIGRAVEGVWHTAVVAYGREFFYGGDGITSCAPGGTQLGPPHRVERLGETFVPHQVFLDYIHGLSSSTFTAGAYDLLEHNCNHFSDEAAQFLCGARVPKHILQQPHELVSAPHRAALQALLAGLAPARAQRAHSRGVERGGERGGERGARRDSPDYDALNHQIEEARIQSRSLERQRSSLADKLARKERRREKKRRKQRGADPHAEMAEAVESLPAAAAAGPSAAEEPDAEDPRAQEEARRRARDPPIVYKDIDGLLEWEQLRGSLEGAPLAEEERASLEELRQYLQGEGSWVLGDDFLAFIGRVLSEGAVKGAAREHALRCLAAAALRDDVALLLHQDRRHHALLNYAHRIDRHPLPEQRALALFMCNLFENVSSAEWLLYISEWDFEGHPLSNIRATTKVCVHALLSEDAELRETGTALLYNIATREVKTVRFQLGKALRDLLPQRAKSKVFDEVCVELAMAVLQLVSLAPGEEHLYRGLRALARLAAHSHDVPQLVAVVGPDPAAFRGTSPRVDDQIDAIMKMVK